MRRFFESVRKETENAVMATTEPGDPLVVETDELDIATAVNLKYNGRLVAFSLGR